MHVCSVGWIPTYFHYHCYHGWSSSPAKLLRVCPDSILSKWFLVAQNEEMFVCSPSSLKKGGGAKRMQDFPMQMKQFSKSGLLLLATVPSSPHQADHRLTNFLGKWMTHTVKSWDFLNDYSFKILLNLLCLNGVCQLLSWVWSLSLLVWAERAWANSFWTQ